MVRDAQLHCAPHHEEITPAVYPCAGAYATLHQQKQIAILRQRGAVLPSYVAMLRGINVGGNPRKMEWLRTTCEELGLRDVRTYLQSGNIVFASSLGTARLAAILKDKIDKQTRLPVPVIVRSAKEMADIIAQNPFLK